MQIIRKQTKSLQFINENMVSMVTEKLKYKLSKTFLCKQHDWRHKFKGKKKRHGSILYINYFKKSDKQGIPTL